ncbi:competence protein ComGA [Bacillus stercoris]|uniref:competence protein ComGA n=1 Tax=Bacillus TaxID=1386 RepID=UPI0002E9B1BD|nr:MULTISPECIES: competence protein ComGA [Bacillus]OEI74855.1 competence protein ComG [Bacillus subtilis]MDN0190007.1 competence protein ComGA [Bacillus sp. B.PNR1]MDN3033947.1 competence protein ComGA [Bacillus sp. B.PNR2]MEC2111128.1 competence protein ComGA [Bacillus stercoris]MEC3613708.1 competence protein ComGA [Bacillus stercoris]
MDSIEKISKNLIEEAYLTKASDIHIVPRERDAIIHFRVDHALLKKRNMKKEECVRLISHFKFLSAMDIGERRKPQNGSLTLKLKEGNVHLRMSTLPTINEESLVIRVMPQYNIPSIDKLSLFPKTGATLLSFLKHSHGMLIFTGPTGSGKTTTLYSLVQYAKKHFNRNIVTLEDPVETRDDDVLQVQVNEKAGVTYSAGLKAILRHDPDMIILGEIRDAETAEIAVRAAMTGHLVLTSLHTRDAKGAIYRLLEFGINMNEIEQTVIAIAAQRLVDLACPFCENGCSSVYCRQSRNTRRAGVYELLYGKNLQQCIQEAKGNHANYQYQTLRQIIRKGIALGYLTTNNYDRWVYHEKD